jgi:hypothetical protein
MGAVITRALDVNLLRGFALWINHEKVPFIICVQRLVAFLTLKVRPVAAAMLQVPSGRICTPQGECLSSIVFVENSADRRRSPHAATQELEPRLRCRGVRQDRRNSCPPVTSNHDSMR